MLTVELDNITFFSNFFFLTSVAEKSFHFLSLPPLSSLSLVMNYLYEVAVTRSLALAAFVPRLVWLWRDFMLRAQRFSLNDTGITRIVLDNI
jgi:hypothetical protein